MKHNQIEFQMVLTPDHDDDYDFGPNGVAERDETDEPDIKSNVSWSIGASFLIDDERPGDTFDIYDFLRSGVTGEYFIFTCSCGVAGCASIWDGIKVKVRKHTVEWRVPAGSKYGLKKRFYSFDRKHYDQIRTEMLQEIRELAKRPDTTFQFGYYGSETLAQRIKTYENAYNNIPERWWT